MNIAKIGDFGLAKTVKHASVVSSVTKGVGTPRYMSPEQYDDESEVPVTEKADVWAFGCILIELFSEGAEMVWGQLSAPQILKKVLKGEAPPVPASVPGAIAHIARRCLSIEPEARPSMQEVLKDLKAI
eukprot:GILI01028783.1.p3 GENE.GILI01028783.1~~GILI01028783.1.p3  ORF type:complete len:129 (-),score=44.23 GILI01028783.1:136-522(-)